MKRVQTVRILSLNLPTWFVRVLGGFGIGSFLYGLIRYTFVGEFFERLYRKTVGHSPIDDFVDSFDPREDLKVLKSDMKVLNNALD